MEQADKLFKLFDVYNDYLIEEVVSNPKLKTAIAKIVEREVERKVAEQMQELSSTDTTKETYNPDRLIGMQELAKLIGKAVGTIRVDITRRPETLPPLSSLPNSRLLKWRMGDVRDWIRKAKKN